MSGDSTVYCLDCLCEIPAKRAAVKPTPRYCIECQQCYDEKRPRDNSYAPAIAALSEGDNVSRFREEGWLNG